MTNYQDDAAIQRVEQWVREYRAGYRAIKPNLDSEEQKELAELLTACIHKYEHFRDECNEDDKTHPLSYDDARKLAIANTNWADDKRQDIMQWSEKDMKLVATETMKLWKDDSDQRMKHRLYLLSAALDCDRNIERADQYDMIKPGEKLLRELKECQENNAELKADYEKMEEAYKKKCAELEECRKMVILPPKK